MLNKWKEKLEDFPKEMESINENIELKNIVSNIKNSKVGSIAD